MANEQNLIPFSERSEEEARKEGRKGGIASGVARRRKRSMREAADLYLSLPPSDRKQWNKVSASGVAPEDIDNQMAIICGLTAKAIKGDSKAAKVLLEMLGEDRKAVDLTVGVSNRELSELTDEELRGMLEEDE